MRLWRLASLIMICLSTPAHADCEFGQDEVLALTTYDHPNYHGLQIGAALADTDDGRIAHLAMVVNDTSDAVSVHWQGHDRTMLVRRTGWYPLETKEMECAALKGHKGAFARVAPSRVKINADPWSTIWVEYFVAASNVTEEVAQSGLTFSRVIYNISEIDEEFEFGQSYLREVGAFVTSSHTLQMLSDGEPGIVSLSISAFEGSGQIAMPSEGYGGLLDRIDELAEQGASVSSARIGPEESEAEITTDLLDQPLDYVLLSIPDGEVTLASVGLSETSAPWLFMSDGQVISATPSWFDELSGVSQ